MTPTEGMSNAAASRWTTPRRMANSLRLGGDFFFSELRALVILLEIGRLSDGWQ
jgi:hypothetical protein